MFLQKWESDCAKDLLSPTPGNRARPLPLRCQCRLGAPSGLENPQHFVGAALVFPFPRRARAPLFSDFGAVTGDGQSATFATEANQQCDDWERTGAED